MRKLLATVALVGTLMAPGSAEAQTPTTVGGAVAYHTDLEALGIGAYVVIPMPQLHENISINPNFIYYFPDIGSYWTLSGDVVYTFPVSADTPVSPFALAGINVSRFSTGDITIGTTTVSGISSTDVGLNLGGGVAFPMESFTPVAGARFEIGDGNGFVLFGGVGFAVGG
jgi:opacity protein-like surface antigen